jgi:CRISPR-associated protein Cmr2
MSTPSDPTFWKRKLAAFLHDPPSKALDIRTHTERSEKAMQAAELGSPEERRVWDHRADHTAAAADRFPFPHYNKGKLSCAFEGVRNQFRHPLNGNDCLPFDGPFITVEEGIEGEQTTQPIVHGLDTLPEGEQWRARFLAHWRLWSGASAAKDWRLAYLPADTRIPDHSIWSHMQMVSALDGCVAADGNLRPAFLKFQLGPVQDFIQAARSTRDLWSGSYLLSWLMAHGMATLALKIGPDAVIFPNLRDQPLVDLAMKGDVWDRVRIGDKTVWKSHASLQWSKDQLLTPNLPNVFLAIVPADRAKELAREVETAIQEEWIRIAESVWKHCDDEMLWKLDDGLQPTKQRRQRFVHQIKTFLSQSWSVSEWPDTLDKVEDLATLLPDNASDKNYQIVKAAAEAILKLGHQDDRYFDTNGKLKNTGIAWALLTALSSWQLDAVRQTRAFAANLTDPIPSRQQTKDSLTGKEEAIAGGPAWLDDKRFKHDGDFLAAPTLVKRLWDKTYLHKAWKNDLGPTPQAMPNTRDLAAHQPTEDTSDDDTPADPCERYFAVLAFDGDDMGKWISGEKTPPFASQLAQYEGGGALEYFQRPSHAKTFEAFMKTPRPLSPGYHLQFSECLSNFALRCARPIVEAFDGRLIYAGGDDVVALLPADAALACANDLQRAFRGEAPFNSESGIQQKAPGFLTSKSHHERTGKVDPANESMIPFMVPGPAASASVGIAIAHFKSPLQDTVRAAQAAEKRAKKLPGKAAVAVTVMKRSGETVEWSARWEDAGVLAASTLLEALQEGVVSSKFPYRLGELISAYRVQSTGLMKPMTLAAGFDLSAIFAHELRTVLIRQRGRFWNEKGAVFEKAFSQHMNKWIESMRAPAGGESEVAAKHLNHSIAQILALCAYCGFAKRQNTSS